MPAVLLAGGVPRRPHRLGGASRLRASPGTAAFLTWFAALARGRSPRGLRDTSAWSIGYGAQAGAYLFLLTDRYPYTGPKAHLAGLEQPEVSERVPELVNDDDYRRSRLTVLLRLPLAFPHIVWLLLWTVLAVLAAIANWFSALAIGRSPRPLARFLSAYIRYAAHVDVVPLRGGQPVPGLRRRAGQLPARRADRSVRAAEPVDHALPAAAHAPGRARVERCRRCALFVAIFGWFVALVRGRMPDGLQAATAYSHRLLGADVRVRVRAHRPLSAREPAGGVRRAGACPATLRSR